MMQFVSSFIFKNMIYIVPTGFIAIVSRPLIIKLSTVQQVVSLQEAIQRADETCCYHHTQRERCSSDQQGIDKRSVIGEEIVHAVSGGKRG